MRETMHASSDGRVTLDAPFVNIDKGDILSQALASGIDPLEYADTWTCYEGGAKPCGKRGACAERAEAFTKAGALDPLLA
jgi:7-cyano-7-deazaguanine synthase